VNYMNPVGLWSLHFDWGPDGNYDWVPIYFNFDNTFAYLAGANEGSWSIGDDIIILRFKRQPEAENNTVYSGTASRNFISGAMLSAQGEKGHWFAVKKGTKVYTLKNDVSLPYLIDKENKPKFDPTGNKLK
jgi:hypothetical protein